MTKPKPRTEPLSAKQVRSMGAYNAKVSLRELVFYLSEDDVGDAILSIENFGWEELADRLFDAAQRRRYPEVPKPVEEEEDEPAEDPAG